MVFLVGASIGVAVYAGYIAGMTPYQLGVLTALVTILVHIVWNYMQDYMAGDLEKASAREYSKLEDELSAPSRHQVVDDSQTATTERISCQIYFSILCRVLQGFCRFVRVSLLALFILAIPAKLGQFYLSCSPAGNMNVCGQSVLPYKFALEYTDIHSWFFSNPNRPMSIDNSAKDNYRFERKYDFSWFFTYPEEYSLVDKNNNIGAVMHQEKYDGSFFSYGYSYTWIITTCKNNTDTSKRSNIQQWRIQEQPQCDVWGYCLRPKFSIFSMNFKKKVVGVLSASTNAESVLVVEKAETQNNQIRKRPPPKSRRLPMSVNSLKNSLIRLTSLKPRRTGFFVNEHAHYDDFWEVEVDVKQKWENKEGTLKKKKTPETKVDPLLGGFLAYRLSEVAANRYNARRRRSSTTRRRRL